MTKPRAGYGDYASTLGTSASSVSGKRNTALPLIPFVSFPVHCKASIFISSHAGGPTLIEFVFAFGWSPVAWKSRRWRKWTRSNLITTTADVLTVQSRKSRISRVGNSARYGIHC